MLNVIYNKVHQATNGKLDDMKDLTKSLIQERDAHLSKLKNIKYNKKNELDRLVSIMCIDSSRWLFI